uniref:Si:ch211-220f12.4 n=1 Tax=Fundulus heteroclitus TaxID=8078 RepID=A0A3Q2PY42_FUNHE
MEFGERKRRRKSQSFKLVTDEGRLRDALLCGVSGCSSGAEFWMGDESMEIKKQITGMMRLLSDKTGSVYQRLGAEQSSSTKEHQDGLMNCLHTPPILSLESEDPHFQSWSSRDPEPPPSSASTSVSNGPGCEIPCCMCNCKGTLQAILHELRAMRRLIREHVRSSCQPHIAVGSAQCRVSQKRRPIYKVAPLSVCSTRRTGLSSLGASPLKAKPTEAAKKEEHEKLDSSKISCDSDVRLAEDYDVFISKAQLDSILVNYTRSGSLLFRKLVCICTLIPCNKKVLGLNPNLWSFCVFSPCICVQRHDDWSLYTALN